MKKLLLTICLLISSMTILAQEAFQVGHWWYTPISDTEVELSAKPDGTSYGRIFDDRGNDYYVNWTIPETVDYNGTTYTVAALGEHCLEGATSMNGMMSGNFGIPATVTNIKANALKNAGGNGIIIRAVAEMTIDPTAFDGNHFGIIACPSCPSFTQVDRVLYATKAEPSELAVYPGYNNRTNNSKQIVTNFTIPAGVTSIRSHAFYATPTLQTINTNEVTAIGDEAFTEATALKTITFGATLTTIGEDAFKGVTTLTSITCNATTPPAVVFEDAVYERIRESGNIHVPEGSLAAYQADPNWGKFWNAAPPAAPKMYIAGSFTNWADGKLEMTESDGTYSITVQGVEQWAEFKFIEENGETTTWYGGDTQGGGDKYGVHPDWCTGIALAAGDAGSNFQVTSGHGDLTFTIDADKNLTITGWAAPANELYLAGSMTNWADNKEALTLDEQTGKFTITKAMEAGAEFKFIDQDGVWIGGDADGNFIVQREQVVNGTELSLLLNGGNNFQIPVAGEWTLTVDKATMKLVISGIWPAPKYTITVAECQNGSVTADKAEAEEGETVTLTVAPAEGYQLKSITVTPETLDLIVEVNENYEFTMPADNVTVTAEFEEIPPVESVITFEAAPANGTVAVYVGEVGIESGATVAEGTEVMVVLTPAEGYEVSTFAVATAEPEVPADLPRRAPVPFNQGENNTYTFEMPAEPVTITAEFAETVVTAISDLRAAGDGNVRYIDVNGRVSDKPFQGINIVVDANGNVTKVVK